MTTEPAPKGQPPQRPAYLVLGMHRSGPSAATQLLALAGANLPDNVMPGDEHNAKGYFEPWRIAVFNDQRLRAGGGAWDDAFTFPYQPTEDEAVWRARALALFREEYGAALNPLLKDPRVSVLMPIWRSVLEAEGLTARCVIPVRHPLAVAGSLARRDQFPIVKSVLLWTTYMLAAEADSRDLARAFVDYDALLADWRTEVARIEAAHGAPLPRLTARAASRIDAFLTPELRHNSADGDLSGLGEVGAVAQEVYDWFKAAARGETPARAPLERATAMLVRMKAEIGVYVSPVTRALDIARAELAEERAKRQSLETERAQVEAVIDAMLAAR
ncbi:MAG TPA: hypothetical protein VFW47_04730 [Phenylobacterium sp.]|nr:hypothetical protein [Phenylobacterium sp.]